MKKTILFVLLMCWVRLSMAIANIGITTLYYSSQANFSNKPVAQTPVESGLIELMAKFNQVVTTTVQTRLAGFTPLLHQELADPDYFTVFDAESTIVMWNKENPNLLTRWERESVTQDIEAAAAEKLSDKESASKSRNKKGSQQLPIIVDKSLAGKYILVGWVKSISANEIRQPFAGTTKTSVLYNLNIEITYKIIDFDTKEVITQFVAAGHGGIARIVPNDTTHKVDAANISLDVVSNAITSLLVSVKHGLMIKQDLGLIPK